MKKTPGNREIMSTREYFTAIYFKLKELIDKKQQAANNEQKVQLKYQLFL